MNRKCGECTLCCKLLPVRELQKGANQRCKHQRGLGCNIYDKRPLSCRLWSCAWLEEPMRTAGLDRPDRTHYVIDMMPDFIEIAESGQRVDVLQIWCDPAHRDAHRDPALRAFLEHEFETRQILGMVRYNSVEAVLLIPPAASHTGEWFERHQEPQDEILPERTPEERFAAWR